MTLHDVVSRMNTTPFLFAGSGVTRRYYNLPNWEELLKHFAEEINKDRFSYRAYESKASSMDHPNGLLPLVATLIQKDYDAKWYADASIRTLDEGGLAMVEAGTAPFKAEVAAYINRKSIPNPDYKNEIDKLRNISKKNLSGVITTNYDVFFDRLLSDYKLFIGQNDLIFSAIQGVAEIYKIHGSVTKPESIVINDADYRTFNESGKYLAAKLMTIFMEYPIIFIGYSLTDENIKNILFDIVRCLPDDKFDRLQERFIFVEYQEDASGASIASHSVTLDNRMLNMTKVILSDFGLLYDALVSKKASIPVKMLRRFKEELYQYVITSQPGPKMQVASLDNPVLNEDMLAISIGVPNIGEYGLKNLLNVDIWYRDLITDEIRNYPYNFDQILDDAFVTVFKGERAFFPLHKALSRSLQPHSEVMEHVAFSFEQLTSKTIRGSRHTVAKYGSPYHLWQEEKTDFKRAVRILCYLPEEKMDVDELEGILKEIFTKDNDILEHASQPVRTDIRRLIRFYDYLKYGKKTLRNECL